MAYTNSDDSNSDLKPILVSVSVVVAILFGGMYFFYQNSLKQETASAAASTSAPAPLEAPQAVTGVNAPVATAVKSKLRSRV